MTNYTSIIFKLIAGVFLSLTMAYSCATIKPVPVETIVQYEIRDSLNIKDSTVIIPIEQLVNIVMPNQKSELETTMAKSEAYTDTLGLLHHNLVNKEGIKYKYIYKDKIVYRDSIVTKEVPVEVEKEVKYVPKFYKWLLVFDGLLLLVFILYILDKMKILKFL